MWLRNRIRQWLGITDLQATQNLTYNNIKDQYHVFNNKLDKLSLQIGSITPGLGRIIAKLDPMYGRPEQDSARKAESDRLGDQVIERLKAEHLARQHTEGKL